MARAVHRLPANAVRKLDRPGFHPDGGGLYLKIGDSGGKSWVFRFTLNGRARMMGLGSVNDVTLGEARETARLARKKLAAGIDPLDEKQARRRKQITADATALTFDEAARRFIAAKSPEWRSEKHAAQWQATIDAHASPVFGSLPVAAVDTNLVLKALEPIWNEMPETASRLRGRIEAVLDWAGATGHRSGANPARWKGNLKNLLPAPQKVRKVKHFPALPYVELPGFMSDLAGREGVAARALEFAILTAARSGEVRLATWGEMDLKARLWTVPADRMKTGKEHRVPLTAKAVAILEAIGEGESGALVFESVLKPGRPLSDMSITAVMRRMGYQGDRATVHGFRSTFRDWAADRTAFPREVAEACLAHSIGGVERAYRRSDLLAKRRKLLEAWERYANAPAVDGDNVRAIGGGA